MKTRSLLAGMSAALVAAAASGWRGAQFMAGSFLDRYATKHARSEIGSTRYQRGPGWTVAQVKRMAKKARNRRRNRAACRG